MGSSLSAYKRMRNFKRTPEPAGATAKGKGPLRFVVQEHHASHLHFDLRFEAEGVLKSWSVPKGPSKTPGEKRLAVQVEDHPLAYRTFKGKIPKGNYGAGEVYIWDEGTYTPEGTTTRDEAEAAMSKALAAGKIRLRFHGKKLHGDYALVRTRRGGAKPQWLLIRLDDKAAKAPPQRPEASGLATPMLATLSDGPFSKKGWIFERKWDGYRALAVVAADGGTRLLSRNGQDLGAKFPAIAAACGELGATAIIDGEIVALDAAGRDSFQHLQHYAAEPNGQLVFAAFDLLFEGGEDLRELPLLERKRRLKKLLGRRKKSAVMFSDHVATKGEELFTAAKKAGWEGLIAKRADSVYREGYRSADWLKIKSSARQEAVICGCIPGKDRGSLVLGVLDDKTGKLRWAGNAATRFRELRAQFDALRRDDPPLADAPKGRSIVWLEPEIVCEVSFQEWTRDGRMRHPIIEGIREDKAASEVRQEHATPGGGYTHTEKIYFPEAGYTKGDLLAYYKAIAPTLLPHLKGRPQSLLRQPEGIKNPGFFQKHARGSLPPFVDTAEVDGSRYIVCNNLETLLYLANLGCIELNPWRSRVDSLDRPDFLVIDLDPEALAYEQVIRIARAAHALLRKVGLPSYPKTSGKRGLHIYVPLAAGYDEGVAETFARAFCEVLHRQLPELTSLERSPKNRQGKVYLDYLRNAHGQTTAAPYCVRPTPEATVSTPLKWSEVKPGLDPTQFTVQTTAARVEALGDLFGPLLDAEEPDLLGAAERLAQLIKAPRPSGSSSAGRKRETSPSTLA